MLRSKRFISLVLISMLILGLASAAQAKYPVSNVTLITHSSPGAGTDVFLRNAIKYLGPIMGTNFVVENIKGGSGAKAIAKLIASPADGSVFYGSTPDVPHDAHGFEDGIHFQGRRPRGERLLRQHDSVYQYG